MLILCLLFGAMGWAAEALATATINKQFTPATVDPGDVGRFRITLANSSLVPLTAAAVTDNLPTNVKIANPANVTDTCAFASVTATPGATRITLSGGTVPASTGTADGQCYFELDVVSTVAGNWVNTIPKNGPSNGFTPGGAISGFQALEGATTVTNTTDAIATLSVRALSRPTGVKTYSPTTGIVGQPFALNIVLTNPNPGSTLPLTSFTDPFPTGMVVAPTPAATVNCTGSGAVNGTFAPNAGDSAITLTGGVIGAGGACTLTVNAVVGAISGATQSFTNTIPANAIGNTRGLTSATFNKAITIRSPVTVTKVLNPTIIRAGQTSSMTITVTNDASATVGLSITSFTDVLPPGLVIAGSGTKTVTCTTGTTGTLTAIAGTDTVTLTGATTGTGSTTANRRCTIVVPVTAAAAGSYVNTTRNTDPDTVITNAQVSPAGLPVPTATATLNVNAQFTVAKAVSDSTVAPGDTTTFTVTISNWSAGAVGGVAFSDLLPLVNGYQMVVGGTGAILGAGCSGGIFSGSLGAASVTWTGGTVTAATGAAPSGTNGICTITIPATLPADAPNATVFINEIPIGAITGNGGISNTNAAAANVATVSAVSVAKAFSPTSVAQGQSSTLTVTLTNGTLSPITGVALTDTLPTAPGAVTVAAVPNATTTCTNGVVTAAPGGASVSLSGATIPDNGSCTFSVKVTGNTVGVHANTIPAGALASTSGATNPSDAVANLTITTGVTGTKTFTPTAVRPGGVSRVTIRVNNLTPIPLTNVSITDPATTNLTIANPANATTTCAGSPSITAVPGTSVASLTGATIAAGGNCLFLFDVVTNPASGSNWVNTIPAGSITSAEGPQNTASIAATLTRNTTTSIGINKSFDPVIVSGGQPSVLRIDVTNPVGSPSGADNVTFTDNLPSGIQVYAVPNASTTCTNGVVTVVPGGATVRLSGGTLPANSTCSVFVTTTSIKLLNLINTIPVSAVTSTQGYTNSLATSATLSTLAGLGAAKSFAPTSVSAGQTATLTILLTSTRDALQSPSTITHGVSFTDTLPSGMTVAAEPRASTTCTSGSVTASAGTNLITLSGATINPEASCVVQVDVVAAALGAYTNIIPAGELESTEGFTNQFDAVASLNVLTPPAIAKGFSPAPVRAGELSTLTITVTNANAQALTGASLTDNLPAGLAVANPANASTTCTGGAVAAPVAGSSVALTNATLPASGSCTFQADVVSNVPGDYANTIPVGALTTSQGVSNTAAASATLTVLQPPTVAKAFSPSILDVGGTSLLTLTLGNSNTSPLTLAAVLTDALPGVVKVASPNNLGGTCTLGSVTALPGSSTITYAAGAGIPVGGCTILVNVTSAQGGSNLNLIAPSALSTDGGDNQTAATATLVVTAGSLGDRVWNDSNGDGVQDLDEVGLTGVTVFLDTDNSGTLDPGEASTVTAGDGTYTFSNLAAGTYDVRIVPASLPANFVPSYDLDGIGTSHVATATLTAGQTLATIDFGYRQKPDLAVTKTNGVTAVNAGSTTTYTITVVNQGPTAANGALVTDPAAAGLVKTGTPSCTAAGGAVCPSLTNAALEGAGVTIDTLPSGGNLTITVTAQATATAGSVTNTATASLAGGMTDPTPGDNTASDTDTVTPVYAIGNTVWFDTNHDGIQDAAESGIAGMTVNLFDSTGTSLLASTGTDGAGLYRFDGLVAGTYVVEFVPRVGLGYVASPVNQGSGSLAASFDSNIDAATLKATVVVTNAADMTIDAGFYQPMVNPARIGDRVWYDTNQNGIQDSGEPGLDGVTVRLLDADHANAVWATTVSDGNGAYAFTGLPAGNFVIDFVAPTGYSHSPLQAGGTDATDSDANASTGLTGAIALAAGQALSTVDAGLYLTGSSPGDPAASIGDLVWYDTNGDGIQDVGEPGIPGVEVRLYNAAGTTLIATARTDITGAYAFNGLAAGTWTVAFILPGTGYALSPTGAGSAATGSDPDPVTGRVEVAVTAGQTRTDIDAGLYVPGQAPISIGDFVWKDLDADGLPDDNEGLAGAEVVLYDSLGQALARLTTSATTTTATNYSFPGLPAGGSYRVAVDTSTIAGLTQLADPDATLDHRHDLIGPTASTSAVDFGYLAADPSVSITKTAGDGSDSQQLLSGGTAGFKLTVTNTGNLTLTNLTVVDPLAPNCDHNIASLSPGAISTVVSCALSPVSADFTNLATVTAQPVDAGNNPFGAPVSDDDGSLVDVINPAITIVKTATNSPVTSGEDATFSITVTNTGDVALTNVAVVDPLAANCAKTIGALAIGASDSYTCSLANVTAPFFNVATVNATPPLGATLSATADAYVNVVTPGLSIYKSPDSQTIRTGGTASFTITVTNTGTADLPTVVVSDPNTPACNRANVGPLAVGAHVDYPCTATNVPASFFNTITATADALTVNDIAEVVVIDPQLSIVKTTNGADGQQLRSGFFVHWTYLVTNTGDGPLTNVGVTDDQGVPVTCPRTTLAVAEAMTCNGYGMSTLGAYANLGTVTGTAPDNLPVTGTDPSSYTGVNPAVIGNRVWLDENGDGVQDAGEAGIPNLTVTLYAGVSQTPYLTTLTDALGGYLFTALPPGDYRVVVTPSAGLNPTWNEYTGTTAPDSESLVTVTAGADHLTADFGYNWVPPADSTNPGAATTGAIGDRIWNDTDGDGLQDSGEAGIAGVTVTLTGAGADGIFGNADDPSPVVTTTGAAGNYIFDDLPKGSYRVTATPPTGAWTQTGDPDLGGPVDNTTTTPIVLAPGDVYVNADFGYRPATGSSIGDTIWFDANPDGVQNPGELGIPGVTVALLSGGAVIATTITDSAGQYLFAGLPAGTYTVAVTDTDHLLDAQLSYDPDPTKDAQTTVTVNGTDSVLTADFGYTALNQKPGDGLIGDFVFIDRDGNGQPGPGEGVQGVMVRLYAANGTTLLAETATNPVGVYGFGGLDVTQTYVVKVATDTLPNGGTGMVNTIDPDTIGTGDNQSTVVNLVATAGRNLAQDFGYRVTTNPAAIGGLLWEDEDADGIHQHDASVHRHLAGFTLALYDTSGDLVGTTVTDSNGAYLFTGLSPGSYTVDVTDTANLLDGWWHSLGDQSEDSDDTSKSDPFTLTVVAGETNTNVDFGYYNAGAALGNRVWLDADGDGIQDLTETTGLAGVAVELVITYPNDGGTTTLVVSTDSSGRYSFGNLLLDESFYGTGGSEPTYVIRIATPPSGTVPGLIGQGGNTLTDSNDPAGTSATVLKGQTNTALAADPATEPTNAGYDFAYTGAATVTGHLYIDRDGNGRQDPGEPDLAFVDVVITDRNGTTYRATSDANGDYSSATVAPAGIPAGSASVNVDAADPEFPTGYTQTEGDNPTAITVPNSGTIDAGNDGYYPPSALLGTVTGHLFIDTNRDGEQNPGEPNLAGVDVVITDRFGATQTVTSNADGDYSAVVPAGTTTANVVDTDPQIPTGYEHTAGTDPNSETAVAGTSTDIGSDGYGPPLSTLGGLTGRVYLDTNGNGLQDPGEPGIADLDVLVTDQDGSVQRITTNADGDYTASGLPAGQATVALDSGDSEYPTGLAQTEGGDPTTTTVVATETANAGRDGFHAPTGSIGDRVWLDEDGDGVQDTGEAGIANLTIELYRADQDPSTDTPVATTRTNSDGGYLFADVPAGIGYQVRVIPPTGMFPTADEDGTPSENLSAVPTLASGAMHLSADFGYNWVSPADSTAPASATTGAIGDRVWSDANGNGRQDPGEPGIGGVTVGIYIDSDANGTFDALFTGAIDQTGATGSGTTTTATDGGYVFHGLPAGAYAVRVTTPAGYSQTGDPDQPGAPCTGCDARTTSPVVLAPGDVWVNADFGYRSTDVYVVSGSVYLDPNANGTRLNEPGIPGVTVNLVGAGDTVLATATTDAEGNYSFPGVAPGIYTVVVGDTADLLASLTQSGDPDATLNEQTPVTLTNASVTGLDFGYVPAYHEAGDGLIGDTIFLDRNGDNALDVGEGLGGVTVELYAANGTTLLGSADTDANGNYWFGALDPLATYLVRVAVGTLPAGVTNTVDPDGTTGDGESSRNLPSLGAIDLAADFGYRATTPNTIGGTLWRDSNGDGLLTEAGGFAGVTVELRDATGAVVGTTVTDANGDYSFAGLPDGTYSIQVTDTSNLLNGWWKSTGPSAGADGNSQADPYSVAIAGGQTNTTGDFGYFLAGGALGNRAWLDSDNDGVQDAGETVIADLLIRLVVSYPNGASSTLYTATGADGGYAFANLLQDESFDGSGGGEPTYTISVPTAPSGHVASPQGQGSALTDSDNPAGATATVARGQTDTAVLANPAAEAANAGYDFGWYPSGGGGSGTVSGHVYIDNNGDGDWTPGTDTPLVSVDVVITDSLGQPHKVTTDRNGFFSQTVPPGLTLVDVDNADLPAGAPLDSGSTDPTTVTVPLNGMASDDTGYVLPANSGLVNGTVYQDNDDSGTFTSGDTPIANVDVRITDANNVQYTVTTDANGYFEQVVPPGSTLVDVQEGGSAFPADLELTTDASGQGSDPTTVTVPAGGAASDHTGYRESTAPPASLVTTVIGNRVWLDENGDGVQDAGEAGIANVKVELVDGSDNVLQTTYTDALGGYLFTVDPGTYTVRVTPSAGLSPTWNEDTGGTNPDSETAVTVTAGQEHLTADFGYNWVTPDATTNPDTNAPGALGDRIWNDADGDGVQDPGEMGLAGVQVTILYDENGDGVFDTVYTSALNPDGTANGTGVATTDASGNYIFAGLPPGAYVVSVNPATLPTGFNQKPSGDPDGDGDNLSLPILIAPGDVFVNADFGYKLDTDTNPNTGKDASGGSSIGDRVYLDANGDGLDGGLTGLGAEPGIAGVTVTLLDGSGKVIATMVTNANGQYLFSGLPSGTYTVVVTDTANVLGELAQTGDPDVTLDRRSQTTVTGVTGQNVLTLDFGFAPNGADPALGVIGDTVFLDRDGNGQPGVGEGLEGVLVELYDASGITLLASTTTNENGTYAFGGLNPAGTYTVRVDTASLPAGLSNSVDPDEIKDSSAVRVLGTTGPVDLGADFGYVATTPNIIAGTVWADRNADGTLTNGTGGTPNEPGIPDVTVALYDSDGFLVAQSVTDATGNYQFAGLPDGTYRVVVTDTAGVLTGAWKSDGPADGSDNNSQLTPYAVTVQGGVVNTTGDFGYYTALAALGNRVWADDHNGYQEPWDKPLAGVLVRLTTTYPNGDVVTLSTHSDANGAYAFPNLLADEDFNSSCTAGSGCTTPIYVLSVPTPPGYTPSPVNQGLDPLRDSNNPAGTTATVLKGQTDVALRADPDTEAANAGYDFGFMAEGPLSCSVICDVNSSGTVTTADLSLIMGLRGKRVTAGAAHSGDCVADGVLSINDMSACRAYLN